MDHRTLLHIERLLAAPRIALTLALAALSADAAQEVTTRIVRDGTVGADASLQPVEASDVWEIGEIHGERPGSGPNLFHSFQSFDVGTGDTALFTADPSRVTENVISRVTGDDASDIYGTIRSKIPGADLYLMNPEGIVFGPDAQLDVEGSFHATTADYLEFGFDANQRFYANPAAGSVLSPVDVTAFGFLGADPAPITFKGGTLTVPESEELTLVGGDIELTGGGGFLNSGIYVPGGRLTLVSVGSPGKAGRFTGLEGFLELGEVRIHPSSFIYAYGEAGGSVTVIADSLLLFNDSWIAVDSTGGTDGGSILVQLDSELALGADAVIESRTFGSGRGSDIRIEAAGVLLLPGAVIDTRSLGPGRGGDIKVAAKVVDLRGGIMVTDAGSTGRAGDIFVDATLLELDAAVLVSLTRSQGDTGDLEVSAWNLVLDNGSNIGTGAILGSESGTPGITKIIVFGPAELRGASMIRSLAGEESKQPSGDIVLFADQLRLAEGSKIETFNLGAGISGSVIMGLGRLIATEGGSVTSNTAGAGRGGAVEISASESVSLSGAGSRLASSSSGSGEGGLISIGTPVLTVEDGAKLHSDALSSGAAGSIFVNVGQLVLSSGGQISGEARAGGQGAIMFVEATESAVVSGPGSWISTSSIAEGNAGYLTITTPELTVEEGGIIQGNAVGSSGDRSAVIINVGRLTLRDGGWISTNTVGSDSPGALDVNASESVTIEGHGLDQENLTAVLSNTFGSGIGGNINMTTPQLTVRNAMIQAGTVGVGNGGKLKIDVDTVSLSDGGQISTSSSGDGQAGDVEVNAENISISGTNAEGFPSGMFASAQAGGHGGTIDATANHLVIDNGGILSTQTIKSGMGGNINVDVGRLYVRGGSSITSQSFGSGDAGDLNVDVSGDLLVSRASIRTSAESANGGNIEIRTGDLLHLAQGRITTSVKGAKGRGGNITTNSELLVLDQSEIRADAFGGPGGNIDILAKAILRTPDSVVSASSELGVQGQINIQAPDAALEAGLTQLPAVFLDASALLRPSCAARATAGQEGSLVVARRRRGLAGSPEELLVAFDALGTSAPVGAAPSVQDAMAEGTRAFRGGRFEEASQRWAEASHLSSEAGDDTTRGDALRALGQSQQAQGRYAESVETLRTALRLTEESGDRARLASTLGSLGNAYLALGEPEAAEQLLTRGIILAKETGDTALTCGILNNLGNHHASRLHFKQALETYLESAQLAAAAGNPLLEAQALSNAARAALEAGRSERAAELLDRASERAHSLPNTHAKVFVLIHLAKSQERLASTSAAHRRSSLLGAHASLVSADDISEQIDDQRALSYALGNLGALYHGERRNDEALHLTRKALSAAEAAEAPESIYRWHWQEGKILWAQGEPNAALRAYRRAVDILDETRQESLDRYGSSVAFFRRAVAPVYLDFVDGLLQGSGMLDDRTQSRTLLDEARITLEQFKAAELRDYFRDECVAELEAKATQLEEVSATAAVVYPILLPNRTELLVSLPAGLERFTVAVGAETVTSTARRFRRELQDVKRTDYLETARRLYNWLVLPYQRRLEAQQVDTLVFVPGGALRTVPMAALHDGERFLMAKYALAVTPSLSLLAPQPLDREHARFLLGGVSEAVQGFDALAKVPDELAAVKALYGGELLLDRDFQLGRVEKAVVEEQPSVVHLASHAVFTGDPASSFLLTHDSRLTMDRLGDVVGKTRFRKQPLELLMLSACQTAAGDDRAGLGLAGVAIRAGARSAVGSLWSIADEAAYELVVEFYEQLKDPSVSKAVALQRAQEKLLASKNFAHPFYWSPFLLISNWL